MNRRGFLGSILALGAAPAVVKAESLMRLWVPPQDIVLRTGNIGHIDSFRFIESFYRADFAKTLNQQWDEAFWGPSIVTLLADRQRKVNEANRRMVEILTRRDDEAWVYLPPTPVLR